MRLIEFTNAEEQLALWKLVSDNVWTAINTQAQQQARARAEKQAREKIKPKRTRASPSAPYAPKPPPNKKPQAPLAKQSPSPLNKPNPNALNAVQPLPSTNPQLNQPPTNTASNPKLASLPYPKPIATTPIKQHNGLKMGYFGRNIGTLEKEDDGDDRHSKNGIATLKKPA